MNDKDTAYTLLYKQLSALIEGESKQISVLSNFTAMLKETFPERFFWVGFYLVDGNELILGPFQGNTACMHIGYGKGVCGTAWKEQRSLVVPDVEDFPGHIACSSLSRSEIVVPVYSKKGDIYAVLDIDSTAPAAFDDTDRTHLEKIVRLLAEYGV